MPKNEELAKAVQNHSILQNGSSIPPSSIHTSTDSPHRKEQGQRLNKQETDAENSNEDLKSSDGIDDRLERLTVKEAKGQRTDAKVQGEPAQEAVEIDSYYVSHSSSNNATGTLIFVHEENIFNKIEINCLESANFWWNFTKSISAKTEKPF